ncbi:MAG: hypothetical protein A2931_04440 [Candidatus Niyogibacteria bacterium RIFCSPLOWO2_01_FULL_45_48]|uniref:Pilus assembly protein PilO n=2 Tax=Candidatus Niyogiibacteriota TaxID=1817912 RepID=A0A1G2EWW3_9BACT|nr:MAG: hypothetical protein A2835_02760 [Candidatus Niyogibacteria bacterium RIFCSPHIGHO2_01_FULL_45_28]OGZ29614.1 MAG: hypothetical protein A2931_04440 [Candidatus Niyogibacteria bacterium RIFCSPLOWO2_01_FULL_45_48]OGZ30233.1 MAG: hypothetical protein A3J00_01045 [Candidatus Niyogibacteria bacterium RIFCSPLOWO2_02_FULL_45_13]
MRLIISILLLLAGVAILFFWAGDLWLDIQALGIEKNAYESVITRLNQFRKTRDALLSNYNSIPASELQKIKNFLPETVNSGALVVQMANITNESGLLLKSINMGSAEEKTPEAPLILSVSGSFENFYAFLQRIEKSLRLIDVKRISFSSGRDNFYDFSLEAGVYFQK